MNRETEKKKVSRKKEYKIKDKWKMEK